VEKRLPKAGAPPEPKKSLRGQQDQFFARNDDGDLELGDDFDDALLDDFDDALETLEQSKHWELRSQQTILVRTCILQEYRKACLVLSKRLGRESELLSWSVESPLNDELFFPENVDEMFRYKSCYLI
jgi:hypothetical protein